MIGDIYILYQNQYHFITNELNRGLCCLCQVFHATSYGIVVLSANTYLWWHRGTKHYFNLLRVYKTYTLRCNLTKRLRICVRVYVLYLNFLFKHGEPTKISTLLQTAKRIAFGLWNRNLRPETDNWGCPGFHQCHANFIWNGLIWFVIIKSHALTMIHSNKALT